VSFGIKKEGLMKKLSRRQRIIVNRARRERKGKGNRYPKVHSRWKAFPDPLAQKAVIKWYAVKRA
jgi:hypothetical protein